MKKAVLIKDKLDGFNGHASLYKLDPPLESISYIDDTKSYHKYVIVSAANVMFSGPETYIFPATETGDIVSWLELDGSIRGKLSHEKALSNAGYTIED